jgi:hypothetical protein
MATTGQQGPEGFSAYGSIPVIARKTPNNRSEVPTNMSKMATKRFM